MSKLPRWAIIAGSLAALVVPFAAAAHSGSDGMSRGQRRGTSAHGDSDGVVTMTTTVQAWGRNASG